jgi:hypothetical protein
MKLFIQLVSDSGVTIISSSVPFENGTTDFILPNPVLEVDNKYSVNGLTVKLEVNQSLNEDT